METSVKERLKSIIRDYGIKEAAFCREIGVSQGFIAGMRKSIQPDKILRISKSYPTWNTEWIITGVGRMYKDLEPQGKTQIISEDNNIATMGAHNKINVTRQNSEPKPQISYSSGRPYYNVDFLGGWDELINDQTTTPEYYIDFAPYNRPDVVWCNITGDSMEPRISSGDIIALRPIVDWHLFLEYGKTYAIVTTNDIRTVKKVRKGSDKDHLLLVPENLDKYDEQEIQKSMIRSVFEVLGSMKKI